MIKQVALNFGFWLSRKINMPLVCPETLQLSMTNRCNLRCKMCSVWSNYQPENELTLQEMQDIIDQAAAWGIREINLCGGEPLLNPHCFEVIRHAKAKKMRVILTTNGTVINESVAKQLLDTKVDIICVSLDGATAVVHDHLRGLEGAYEKIIRGIQFLNDNEGAAGHKPIKVLIMTLHNDNLDEVLDYVSLAKRMRIDSLYITSLVLDNVKLYSRVIESPLWIKGERLKKLDWTIDKLVSLQQTHYGFSYPSFHLIKRYFRGELKQKDWVCFAGFRRFVVCSDGNIQMCGEIIGNIRQVKDMRQIWRSGKVCQKRKKIKQCRTYCLQDCHARQESSTFKNVVQPLLRKT